MHTDNYQTSTKKSLKDSAFMGAFMGALSVAGLIWMSDKGNRERLQQKMSGLKKIGEQKLNNAQDMIEDKKDAIRSEVATMAGRVEQRARTARKVAEDTDTDQSED